MSTKTEASPRGGAALASPASAATARKPRFALFLATAGGLGYIPIAPGTWGSLLGAVLTWINLSIANSNMRLAASPANGFWADRTPGTNFLINQSAAALVVLLIGLWAASQTASYLQTRDPQIVVVDEVSGQLIAYTGLLTAGPIPHYWKYLLLGLILFRVFDIWKPFPARQAESLPAGWGIMADDWMAGIYAAIALWIARAAGF